MASSRNDDDNCGFAIALLRVCFYFLSFLAAMFVTVIGLMYLPPHYVNLDGVQANFTTFAGTTNHALNYTLDLSVSLRNPNNYYDVHHHKIEAMTFLNNPTDVDAFSIGSMLNLNSISQKAKSNAVITPSFKGVISKEVDNLVVRLDLENKYKSWFLGWKVMSEFVCDLKVPSINGNSGQSTEEACKVIYHRRYDFPTPLKVLYYFWIPLVGSIFVWLLPVCRPLYYVLGGIASFLVTVCLLIIM